MVIKGQSELELAVIVPVYRGREFLDQLYQRLIASLSNITDRFAILLVDDGSPDDAWPHIRSLGQRDSRVLGLQLSRNFGQHYALTAGIDHIRARWYVVMDGDLQDAPEDIPALYAKAMEGYDIVVATRPRRAHSRAKISGSWFFYNAFGYFSGLPGSWQQGNFRIFCEPVASGFREVREQLRFFPATLSWMGFRVGECQVTHHARAEGKSSYTLARLLKLGVNTILAHSELPLKAVAGFGFLASAISVLAAAVIILRKLIWGVAVSGWTSLIVAVCLTSGIEIFILGILGVYIGKNFAESKKRPLYFVRDAVNVSSSQASSHSRSEKV